MSSTIRALPIRFWMIIVLTLLATACAVPPAHAARYVCPPCGALCDTLTFDHPGVCPKCGMTLVDASSVQAQPAPGGTKVAILLFDGVEIIDSMGPYEIFGAAGYDVYAVAATKQPVTSAMGQAMVPKYSFADAPQADVLVVPGGGVYGAVHDAATLAWVRSASAKTKLTMSVCNGAFILAEAGLLDGLTATTTAHNIPKLREQYSKVTVVEDKRFVDNGHVITTGGLSAGIDGALHVVERLNGTGDAQQVALGEEYDWSAHARFARAALADQLIPNVPMETLGKWDVVRTEGDTNHWDLEMRGTSDLTADALFDQVGRALQDRGKWLAASDRAHPASGTRAWRFTGRNGESWGGIMSIQPRTDTTHGYTLKLSITRAG
jgi:putative intracellular protease/amidase